MSLLRIKELEAQLARRDERIEQLDMWHSIETERADELEESVKMQKERISELEMDAARYRWLREYGFGIPFLKEDLDVKIDAAMNK